MKKGAGEGWLDQVAYGESSTAQRSGWQNFACLDL